MNISETIKDISKKNSSLFIFLLLSFELFCQNKLNNTAISKQEIYGNWLVCKYLPCKVSALSQEQVNNLLKGRIIIYPNLSVIFGDTCRALKLSCVKRESRTFLKQEIGIDKGDLGIYLDSIIVYDIGCNMTPSYSSNIYPNYSFYIFTGNKKDLFIRYQGVIFQLQRNTKKKKMNKDD